MRFKLLYCRICRIWIRDVFWLDSRRVLVGAVGTKGAESKTRLESRSCSQAIFFGFFHFGIICDRLAVAEIVVVISLLAEFLLGDIGAAARVPAVSISALGVVIAVPTWVAYAQTVA